MGKAGPTLEERLKQVQEHLARAAGRAGRTPEEIRLVAVTKGVDVAIIREAHALGLRHFGESRVQEAVPKLAAFSHLEPPPTWHFVGHLQSNKAKTAVSLFDIIHSVDSVKLAQILSQHAERVQPILLEVNVSGEATKYGFSPEEVIKAALEIGHLPRLELRGLMTIAPLVENQEEARSYFRRLRELRDTLGLQELSMGMSDDFAVAVEEGATMVRIGRALFGE